MLWCEDSWHDNYEGVPTDGSAWKIDNDDDYRLLRGGSWIDHPNGCRSAFRLKYSPGNPNAGNVGFRVVCEAARTL